MEKCEVLVKEVAEHNLVSDIKLDKPEFDTALFHSNWSNLRQKYLSQIPTDINVLSCGPKPKKISWIWDAISPVRRPQKSSQHVRARAAGDGAICSKNRKIVPYHGPNPNTRNGARLRSPSPIMAPDRIYNKILDCDWFSARLFVTQSACGHVGVRLQVSDLNFFKSDTCNWIPTWFSRQLRAL